MEQRQRRARRVPALYARVYARRLGPEHRGRAAQGKCGGRLSTTAHDMPPTLWRRATRAAMRSHAVRIPKYALPVRFRPWFAAATAGVMLVLAFLGFTNAAHALPVNDKVLHFVCFGLATGIFYFIVDVEECVRAQTAGWARLTEHSEARRIWFWRHASLMFTAFVCLFCGGVMSEFVQGMLPVRAHSLRV
jgi:hypothetical protein